MSALCLNLPEKNKSEFLQSIYTDRFVVSSPCRERSMLNHGRCLAVLGRRPTFSSFPAFLSAGIVLGLHSPAKT